MRIVITNYKFVILKLIHFQINLMKLLENLVLIKTCLPISQFQFNTILVIIRYSTIFASKFSLSSTSATKVYLNLEIPKVTETIDKCIFLKLLITKKKLINSIYYLIKYHLHSFFLFKNSMTGMVKNMILYKKYQKYMQNCFQRRICLQTIWRQ